MASPATTPTPDVSASTTTTTTSFPIGHVLNTFHELRRRQHGDGDDTSNAPAEPVLHLKPVVGVKRKASTEFETDAPASAPFSLERVLGTFHELRARGGGGGGADIATAPPAPVAQVAGAKRKLDLCATTTTTSQSNVGGDASRPTDPLICLRTSARAHIASTLATIVDPAQSDPGAVTEYARAVEESLYWIFFCTRVGDGGAAIEAATWRRYASAVADVAPVVVDVAAAAATKDTTIEPPWSLARRVVDGPTMLSRRCREDARTRAQLDAAERNLDIIDRLCEEAVEDSAESQVVTCLRCRRGPVAWHCRQTRGGDEGMSVFFECRACGNRWKQ